MKALKDYGVKFNDLKAAVAGLNGTGFLTSELKVVGVKGEDLLIGFIDAMEILEDDKIKGLPSDINKFYESLPQEVFDDAPPKNEAVVSSEAGSDAAVAGENQQACPTFGDYNAKEDDCKACNTDFPDEHKACVEETKKRAKAQKKADAPPKSKAKKSRYGHLLNSMAGDIDDLIFIGCHMDEMVKVISKKHDRPEDKARAKIRSHIAYLAGTRKLGIDEKEGFVKSDTPFLKGYDESNTEVVFSEIPTKVKPKAKA